LIEGASEGKGLGIKFLRHLERTRVLLHLVDISDITSYKELENRIKIINKELGNHGEKLRKLPQIQVLTKIDAFGDKTLLEAWVKRLRRKKKGAFSISAATGVGLNDLLEAAWNILSQETVKGEADKEKPTESLFQAPRRFAIEKEEDGFHITGPEIQKWVAMTNFDSPQAVERFYKIMGRMGVLKKLKKMGITEGETVFCETEEMTFTSNIRGASRDA